MIVKCEQCKTRFRLADERVPPSGARVRCARCRHVFRVLASHQPSYAPQQAYIPQQAYSPSLPMPVAQPFADPFAFFGEPAQVGTSEPTRPGIFLPGLEASRRIEEGKALMQPPRVPVFGGGSGANISKLFAEKMAERTTGATPPEVGMPNLLSVARSGELPAMQEDETVRVEYLGTETTASQSQGGAAPAFLETEPVSLGEEKPSASEGEETLSMEPSAQGTLASLLSAASEDIVQDKNASELRRANESEIRRAFVQSKTKVKRRKRLRRFLKVFVPLVVVMFLLSGGVIYWKEGQVLQRKPNGEMDWGRTFSWERLKKSLFSEAMEAEAASGLYVMHSGQQGVEALRAVVETKEA